MLDDQEIIRAKAVLRNAGYYCVPREKVLGIGANQFIDHTALARYGDEHGYIEKVIKDMHIRMGAEMFKAKVCSLTMDDDPTFVGGGINYRLRANIIPHEFITDPLLDFMREKQG